MPAPVPPESDQLREQFGVSAMDDRAPPFNEKLQADFNRSMVGSSGSDLGWVPTSMSSQGSLVDEFRGHIQSSWWTKQRQVRPTEHADGAPPPPTALSDRLQSEFDVGLALDSSASEASSRDKHTMSIAESMWSPAVVALSQSGCYNAGGPSISSYRGARSAIARTGHATACT